MVDPAAITQDHKHYFQQQCSYTHRVVTFGTAPTKKRHVVITIDSRLLSMLSPSCHTRFITTTIYAETSSKVFVVRHDMESLLNREAKVNSFRRSRETLGNRTVFTISSDALDN